MKLRTGKCIPPLTKISSHDARGSKRKSKHVTKDNVDNAPKKPKFKQFDIISIDPSDHHYMKKSKAQKSKNPSLQKKIMKEWKMLETNLPESIFVRVYERNTNILRAVIIGPSGTPYHDGLFFFDLYFPSQYPEVPPKVYYHAHGLRLNPNLYDNGYVCLSLLNTWTGQTSERWNPNESTILQVLISIQGLVLNSEPFYNEPVYDGHNGSPQYQSQSKEYTNNAFLLSCKTMVYLLRTPPKSFERFVVDHFLDRGKTILGACKAYIDGKVAIGCYDMDEKGGSNSSCSIKNDFKNSLENVVSQLVEGFIKIGVDVDQDINDAFAFKKGVNHNSRLRIVEGIKKKVKQGLAKVFVC